MLVVEWATVFIAMIKVVAKTTVTALVIVIITVTVTVTSIMIVMIKAVVTIVTRRRENGAIVEQISCCVKTVYSFF